MRLELKGRIESNSAGRVEQELLTALADQKNEPVVLDAENLEYISSAGLRILLRLRKTHPDLSIENVSPEVYDILEMTGFTEMMPVSRAYRKLSLDGCEAIGKGAKGTVYRYNDDTVVKLYEDKDALEEIRHERKMARLALILGIPTAISYDVVKVDDCYGSVFELLNSRSFAHIIAEEPEKMDWCVREYVDMLKKIHATKVPEGKLSDIKDKVMQWTEILRDALPAEAAEKLISLVREVPYDPHMLHGDYHTKNILLVGDEVLLIDMDTLSTGYPIFEFGLMFNAFRGFSEFDHPVIKAFQGFDFDTSQIFWHKVLAAYLGTDDEKMIQDLENKAAIVGYSRLLCRVLQGKVEDTEQSRREFELRKEKLLRLLETTDSLLFSCCEIEMDAVRGNLDEVISFIESFLDKTDCSPRIRMQIQLAAEEIFVNIADYAYAPGTGKAAVRAELSEEPSGIVITFRDSGMPYDPTVREDPDITKPAEERRIGGLGVYLTKKTMDEVSYEYKDGQNVLVLKKYF